MAFMISAGDAACSSARKTSLSASRASSRETGSPLQRREGDDPVEVPLELTDRGLDLGGEEERDVVIERDLVRVRLLPQDRDLRLEVRELDVDDEPSLEAALEALREARNLARRDVGREDDLVALVIERVERVEELVLGRLLADDELNVVEQEKICGPETLAHGLHLVEAQAENDLVHEVLGGQVDDLLARTAREAPVADRLHEMRLAEARAAADEERVVLAGGLVRDPERGGVREPVRGARHEVLERVGRVQAARRAGAARRDASADRRRSGTRRRLRNGFHGCPRPRDAPLPRSARRRPPGCNRRRAASSPGRRSPRASRTSAESPGTRSRTPARPRGSSGARGSWPRNSAFPQEVHRCANRSLRAGARPTSRLAGVKGPAG